MIKMDIKQNSLPLKRKRDETTHRAPHGYNTNVPIIRLFLHICDADGNNRGLEGTNLSESFNSVISREN